MTSLFGSLEIGRKSLLAHQAALEVTSNNIANVNTPGFSRQRAVLQTAFPVLTAAGQVGTGVDVKSIESIRDRFLELRLSQGTQDNTKQEVVVDTLNQVESLFSLGNQGLQEGLSRFFNSFTSLSSDPESISLRNSVVSAGTNLQSLFQSLNQQLVDIQGNVNASVEEAINEANGLAERIATLNAQIGAAEATNTEASTLRDQRGVLLNELAELVDIQYYESEDGSFYVSVAGGRNLVTANTTQPLGVTPTPPAGYFQITIASTDVTSSVQGGKLAGYLQLRDQLIPDYLSDLDRLAQAVIDEVNLLHAAGTNLQAAPGNTGINFFSPTAPGASAAETFSVDAAILNDVNNIAAGGPPFPGPPPGPGPGDNATALQIADLINQELMNGGTETFAQATGSLLFKVGSESKGAQQTLLTQSAVLNQLKNQRDAVSAVSLDEEAINLIRFQRAYQASARFMSTIDQLTGELIDRLGR